MMSTESDLIMLVSVIKTYDELRVQNANLCKLMAAMRALAVSPERNTNALMGCLAAMLLKCVASQ